MGGFASSRVLEVHGERMIKRMFNPGFRVELHQKDLNLALTTARQLGVSLPSTAVCQELFNFCTSHGGRAWDHSGLVRALETLAGFELGQPTNQVADDVLGQARESSGPDADKPC
jgi:2-hydroxy-3-oxopropionate reductase